MWPSALMSSCKHTAWNNTDMTYLLPLVCSPSKWGLYWEVPLHLWGREYFPPTFSASASTTLAQGLEQLLCHLHHCLYIRRMVSISTDPLVQPQIPLVQWGAKTLSLQQKGCGSLTWVPQIMLHPLCRVTTSVLLDDSPLSLWNRGHDLLLWDRWTASIQRKRQCLWTSLISLCLSSRYSSKAAK